MEGFGRNEGRAFVELAAEIRKPVVVLKAGKTTEGSRAVSSHTASLAGDYQVFRTCWPNTASSRPAASSS